MHPRCITCLTDFGDPDAPVPQALCCGHVVCVQCVAHIANSTQRCPLNCRDFVSIDSAKPIDFTYENPGTGLDVVASIQRRMQELILDKAASDAAFASVDKQIKSMKEVMLSQRTELTKKRTDLASLMADLQRLEDRVLSTFLESRRRLEAIDKFREERRGLEAVLTDNTTSTADSTRQTVSNETSTTGVVAWSLDTDESEITSNVRKRKRTH